MKNAVKVLVVDDDKSSGALLAEVVKRMGFKPVLATRSLDALNIVKLQTVHAAIVDVLLPKMTGVEMVQEFRKTKFGDSPVVFVSGVFKDRNFAQDAIKKTGAKDFLFKPFAADEIISSLERAFGALLVAEKWNIQSLLTRRLASNREKAKAIEHLDEIQGLDFPFVLGILMEAGISGHLNIVNDVGEIFGVTLVRGAIADVDSTESQATGILALIQKGFLAQEDWDEYQKNGSRKYPLERLVQEGFVSPHAVSVAKHEQILYDFKSICSANTMQINFVPQEDDEEPPKHAVSMAALLNLLGSTLEDFFPQDYLLKFYEPVKDAPLQQNLPLPEDGGMEGVAKIPALKKAIEEGGSLSDALAAAPELERKTYLSLHYLVLGRTVIFDDLQRMKSFETMLERYRKLHGELAGRSPDKIFEYFGGQVRPQPSTVAKIFDEYSRSNHPDQLSKEAPPELVSLCRDVFQLISDAKDIMVDEDKRAALFEELKKEEGERIKRSKELVTDGLDLLRKGQFAPSLEKLREAEKLHSGPMQFLIKTWAELKASTPEKPALFEILKKLDKIDAEDRKSAFYHMVLGLTKKALGDPSAQACFEKCISLDQHFVEARRELSSMNPGGGKEKKLDILNGDISEIVSQLFRRKAD